MHILTHSAGYLDKKKMKEARKKAKAEKERLEKQRQKLLAQQEEERRLLEEASYAQNCWIKHINPCTTQCIQHTQD